MRVIGKNKIIRVKSNEVITRMKELSTQIPGFTPQWFVTKTFKFRSTEDNAIFRWNRYVSDVAKRTKAHVIPIAAIHTDDKGRVHIHAVLMADRKLTYRQVHPDWKCGFSWDHLYKEEEAGIPYILHGHDYIVPTQPFCPRTSRCRKGGCKVKNKFQWNLIHQATQVSASDDPVEVVPVAVGECSERAPYLRSNSITFTGISPSSPLGVGER